MFLTTEMPSEESMQMMKMSEQSRVDYGEDWWKSVAETVIPDIEAIVATNTAHQILKSHLSNIIILFFVYLSTVDVKCLSFIPVFKRSYIVFQLHQYREPMLTSMRKTLDGL